jgi:aspartate racemase
MDLQKASRAPFVSMIDEVVNAVYIDGLKKVGILGTPVTIESNLYQNGLNKLNIRCIKPKKCQNRTLERIIRNIITGSFCKEDKEGLSSVADTLQSRGAEGIILGCTELPLVFPGKYSLPVYNSVKILAMALLQKYYKQNTIKA